MLASNAFYFGTITFFIHKFLPSMHIGRIPFTLFTFPSNDNSPIKATFSWGLFFIIPMLHNMPMAIGKS